MTSDWSWSIFSSSLSNECPAEGTIDLWTCQVDVPEAAVRRLSHQLSEEERLRATRLAGIQSETSFLARRIVVRTIVSCYGGGLAKDVQWVPSLLGKPALRPDLYDRDLQFSWSQTGSTVAVAVSVSSSVGVDVVDTMSWSQLDNSVDIFCTPEEASCLRSLPLTRRATALVQCWAGKEACLKAAGIGLLGDPRGVQVYETDRPLQQTVLRDALLPAELRMTVQHVSLGRGMHAAVASVTPAWQLIRRTLIWCGEDACEYA